MPEEFAEEVSLTGILVSRNKPKKGYVDISGTTYHYADWVEPFLSRYVNGDVVDVRYKQHKNGGKTVVSITKAKDPSKAVAPAATPSPAAAEKSPLKNGNEIKKEQEQGAKPESMIPGSATTKTPPIEPGPVSTGPAQTTSNSLSPSPVQDPAAVPVVHLWTGECPKFGLEVKVNLNNYESIGFWISGTLPDADKLRVALYEEMGKYAQNNPLTKDLIEAYRRRVLA
jgi:hypothetical protein